MQPDGAVTSMIQTNQLTNAIFMKMLLEVRLRIQRNKTCVDGLNSIFKSISIISFRHFT